MEQEIKQLKAEQENLKKALFILWSWNFNPEILSQDELDWFYEFSLKQYVDEKKKNQPEVPPIVINGETETPAVDNPVT